MMITVVIVASILSRQWDRLTGVLEAIYFRPLSNLSFFFYQTIKFLSIKMRAPIAKDA